MYITKVTSSGEVKLYTTSGLYKGNICGNAAYAVWGGDDIGVTTKDNKLKIYSQTGSYKASV